MTLQRWSSARCVSAVRENEEGPRTAAGRISPAELERLAGSLALDPAGWRELVRFEEPRWYCRLALADDYEVWLLSWLPGQKTGFHDHGDAAGAFSVAAGALTERTAAAGAAQIKERQLRAGATQAFGPRHIHDVGNESLGPAVSIHAYSPPLTSMRRFELTTTGLAHAVTATATAGQDW